MAGRAHDVRDAGSRGQFHQGDRGSWNCEFDQAVGVVQQRRDGGAELRVLCGRQLGDFAALLLDRGACLPILLDPVFALERDGELGETQVLRYLNRLADLLFVLARHEEGAFRALRER